MTDGEMGGNLPGPLFCSLCCVITMIYLVKYMLLRRHTASSSGVLKYRNEVGARAAQLV
jgi:hypothetical protein